MKKTRKLFILFLLIISISIPSVPMGYFFWQKHHFNFESSSHVQTLAFVMTLCTKRWSSQKLLDDVLVKKGRAEKTDRRPSQYGKGFVSYEYGKDEVMARGLTEVSVSFDDNNRIVGCYIFLNGDGPFLTIPQNHSWLWP